jgi:hypothetical protein
VLGLVVLLGGIGLIGLVAHGLFGTPPFARQTLTGQRAVLVKTVARLNGGSVVPGSPKSTLAPRCDHRQQSGSGAGRMGSAGYRMCRRPSLGEIVNEDALRC